MSKTLKEKAKEEAVKEKNWKLLMTGGVFLAGALGVTLSPDLALFVGQVLVAAGSALVDHAQSLLDTAAALPVE